MLISYVKLAARMFLRNPFFSAINLIGLAIGFASFFALWQYASSELQADRSVKDGERIARIGFDMRWTNEEGRTGNMMFGIMRSKVTPRLIQDFPEVESFTRVLVQSSFFQKDLVNHGTRLLFSNDDGVSTQKIFREEQVIYGEENFFTFFSIPLVAGDPASVLSQSGDVALSESTARKYFGDSDPIGKQLVLNGETTLQVSGVFPDRPHNSHLRFDIIISNKGLVNRWADAFWGLSHGYVKLRDDAMLASFDKKLKQHEKKYWGDFINDHTRIVMFAQPFYDVPFNRSLTGDDSNFQRSRTQLTIMSVLSIVILILGWINYINLSLSALSRRLQEFGARRANGATAKDLITQFLVESMLINLLAMGLAFTLLQGIRGPASLYFNIYVADLWQTELNTLVLFGTAVITSILVTGLYPAFVCLRNSPTILLSSRQSSSSKSISVSLLTTFQYVSAMALILWAFTINKQLNYILNKDIGLSRDGIVVVEGPIVKSEHYLNDVQTFVDKLGGMIGIDGVTYSRYMVGETSNKPGSINPIGTTDRASTNENGVGENYIPLLGINVLAGRNFMRNDRADVIIVSRSATKMLGYSNVADVLGLRVNITHGDWKDTREAEIIGVIEDYSRRPFLRNMDTNNQVSNSEHEAIVLTYKNALFPELIPENVSLRINPSVPAKRILQQVESLYMEIFAGNTFHWRFLDDRINDNYKNETIARNQITLFTALSIIIACLGLLGIITNKAQRMTKEIGVRKVLGAGLHHIAALLVNSTLRQLLIAVMLGIPLAYFLTGQYLEKFSDQITLPWWHYAIPMMVLVGIMMITICRVVWNAARSNPVEGLRHE